MKNIIIVTNEPFIIDQYLNELYKESSVIVAHDTTEVSFNDESLMAVWKEEINDVEVQKGIYKPDEGDYTIFKVPFAGFAYMVAYNRYYNLANDLNIVISVKENIPTMLYPREKYHLFLDGKFNPSIKVFDECFDLNRSNSLLTEDYDFIIDLIRSDSILYMSKFVNDILTTD